MNRIVEEAMKLEGCPGVGYSSPVAGNTPKGFDCSGFVQYVLLNSGIHLINVPGTTNPLRHSEEFFDFLGYLIHEPAARAGDFVFFSKRGIKPTHLGIYLGDNHMIHSPGVPKSKVEITEISDFVSAFFSGREFIQENQIYFSNPIGYKRVGVHTGRRYQSPFI